MKLVKRTQHHIRPRSRGGGDHNNLVLLPEPFHANFHHLFQNMTVTEVHAFIDIVMEPDTEWTYQDLSRLRKWLSGGKSS